MKKFWYQIIDFYRLIGMTLIWLSSWIFMIPWKTDITTPFYDNIWGGIFALFGATARKTVETQQTPDLLSGLIALFIIILLQLRGIFCLTINPEISEKDDKKHRPLIVILNLLSIIVHTLFFTMLVKIFLFPDKGLSSMAERLQQNMTLTVFTAVCVTGMVLGAANLARFLIVIFSLVAIFFNVNFVSSTMGIWGFLAIIFAVAGFYLEFFYCGINKNNLLMDLAFISGKYEKLELKAKKESDKLGSPIKTGVKIVTKLL